MLAALRRPSPADDGDEDEDYESCSLAHIEGSCEFDIDDFLLRSPAAEVDSEPSSSTADAHAENDAPSDAKRMKCGGGDGTSASRYAARLARNRESAQLSRQRKRRYVEDLEAKVRSMGAVINDLNARIGLVAAENATMRMQLSRNRGLHSPWYGAYGTRPHSFPIPKLKPLAATAKGKSQEKRKKVASTSLLGLLFVLLLFRVAPSSNNVKFTSFSITRMSFRISDIADNTRHNNSSSNSSRNSRVSDCLAGMNCRMDIRPCKVEVGISKEPNGVNSTEILPASLYVPRNGKHVKINGKLLISSEREAADEDSSDASLKSSAVRPEFPLAPYWSSSKVASKKSDAVVGSVNANGPWPQWFREGMAGPMLRSGMCTEVLQFDVPPSPKPASVPPAAAFVNLTAHNSTEDPGNMKRKRTLHDEPVRLPDRTFNKAGSPTGSSDKNNSPASSVVVSVLADPREARDGNGGTRVSSKPMSRVFVAVLLDGTKYVTYSCRLPFSNPGPHLVN